ncbi:cupin domain-containing protein [Pseudomonas asiatica]|uniref:cupin domain-containing protein n=1 Tax=Pseudomonas asiatica TaxID=2219225 RepID=UPI0025709E15|nr:cupin domain-containing protein [Pseudomonas asiatica]WJD72190.1 cupin domain-containing protein [Pseudomonas asiatica]
MSGLTFFKLSDPGIGETGAPAADRLVEGAPTWTTWQLDQQSDRNVATGIWEVTPGAYRSVKGTTWEYCHILSGVSELIEDGQLPRRIQAGDSFVMKPGFTGVWKVLETTRKVWVTVEQQE